jgi:DNA-binding transcriptional ArsR family regulator
MARPPVARLAILDLLKDAGKMTRDQIAEELSMSMSTVKTALRAARKDKQIYIADWLTPPLDVHGKQQAMHAIGNRRDVPMRIKPWSEYYRRYRAKNYAKVLIKEEIRRRGPDNPFTQLITQCRSAPKKQQSATA